MKADQASSVTDPETYLKCKGYYTPDTFTDPQKMLLPAPDPLSSPWYAHTRTHTRARTHTLSLSHTLMGFSQTAPSP